MNRRCLLSTPLGNPLLVISDNIDGGGRDIGGGNIRAALGLRGWEQDHFTSYIKVIMRPPHIPDIILHYDVERYSAKVSILISGSRIFETQILCLISQIKRC